MRRFATVAGLVLAIAGAAGAQDIAGLSATGGCASVPILPAAIPVVEVTIGGKGPYKFAIDTGARGHGRISRIRSMISPSTSCSRSSIQVSTVPSAGSRTT